MQKTYEKILSLDFELYNTKYYWSICWAGLYITDLTFSTIGAQYDVLVNPGVKERFIGNTIKFPFSGERIRKERLFGAVAERIIGAITPDTLIIGHAFENDAKMIIDACHKFGIACPEADFIDTNVLYNAVYGGAESHSLSDLAAKFNIEFDAHNPLEDARAASKVTENLCGGDILGFMDKHKIKPGRLEKQLVRRCVAADSENERTVNTEKYFNIGVKSQSANGKAYFFDSGVFPLQDITEVIKALTAGGGRLVSTAFAADFVVSNNLYVAPDSKIIDFKALLPKLGIKPDGYNFDRKKVVGADGRSITADEYYAQKYPSISAHGALTGKKVSFSKAVELNASFESILNLIVSQGGKISANVAEADIFIVENMSDLKSKLCDGRIRAFLRTRRARPVTAAAFLNP